MQRRAPILHLLPYEPDDALAVSGRGAEEICGYGGLTWSELYNALGGKVARDGPYGEFIFTVGGKLIGVEYRDIEEGIDTFNTWARDWYGLWAWLGHLVEQTLRDPANPLARLYGVTWLATAGDHLLEIADPDILDQWSYNVGLLERHGIWWPREMRRDEL